MSFPYAEIPSVVYHQFRPRYQTFDLKTGQPSYYPVDPDEPPLTPDNAQDQDPDPAAAATAADEAPASDDTKPSDDASNGESTC